MPTGAVAPKTAWSSKDDDVMAFVLSAVLSVGLKAPPPRLPS